jgi:hypothetical protein
VKRTLVAFTSAACLYFLTFFTLQWTKPDFILESNFLYSVYEVSYYPIRWIAAKKNEYCHFENNSYLIIEYDSYHVNFDDGNGGFRLTFDDSLRSKLASHQSGHRVKIKVSRSLRDYGAWTSIFSYSLLDFDDLPS